MDAVPGQKESCTASLFVEEIVPFCGVPEALLSDRAANLLSHLVQDRTLLRTTGIVECLNCTLKAILQKHASQFNTQWDAYLPELLWAYRNTIYESTGEKLPFLFLGIDCNRKTPSEVALLSPNPVDPMDVSDYCQQMVLSLSSTWETAKKCVKKTQEKYKAYYDKKPNYSTTLKHWVLVKFPTKETGKQRKLSQLWHGPYRVSEINDPDAVAVKVYFPREEPMNVHQLRVTLFPHDFPAGYYWYG